MAMHLFLFPMFPRLRLAAVLYLADRNSRLGQCALRRRGEPLSAHGGPGRAGGDAGRTADKGNL